MTRNTLNIASLSLALSLGSGCAPRTAIVTDPSPTGDRFLLIGKSLRLHYLDFGGSGETVVLVPGLGNTAYVYADLGPRLVQRGFRVVALTRRGHGRSSRPVTGYEPDSLAEDIRVLLDTIGVRRAHLVGHSLAGVELTTFASRHPERVGRLVYLDAAYDRRMQAAATQRNPASSPGITDADLSSWAALFAFYKRPDQYYGRIWNSTMEREIREWYDQREDDRLAPRTPRSIYGSILAGASKISPDYSGIRAPVLSYYARPTIEQLLPSTASSAQRDSTVAFQRDVREPLIRASIAQLRTGVPNARIVELAGTYHHLFIQYPERAANEIAAFLKGG